MLQSIINQANWVDILVLIIIIRMVYIGLASGFIIETFKILGLVFATVLGLHYYTVFGDFLNSNWSIDLALADGGSLLILVIFSLLIFKFLRDAIFKFIKMDAHAVLNKWGGTILGAGRALLTSSLVIIILTVSNINYLVFSAQKSISGPKLSGLAPKVYSLSLNGIISKFFPKTKINPAIFELVKSEKS